MQRNFLIRLSILFFSFTSCNGEDIKSAPTKQYSVGLKDNVQVGIGERVRFKPTFSKDAEALTYTWSVENANAQIVAQGDAGDITILGKNEGTFRLTIESTDKQVKQSCTVNVVRKTIKILALGNSFSEDAIECYLYDLAKAEGITLIVGNMFIGGCSLEAHWKYASSNIPAYSYRKIGVDGKKITTADMTIKGAITDEQWDYISFQQASPLSGLPDTYAAHLPQLVDYVRKGISNTPTLLLHRTWAYAQNSSHSGFSNYGKDQLSMYNAIVDATSRALTMAKLDLIIPAGTAIQNGRTSILADNFCRDGYHLDVTYGRYTAACTWFETLFGRSVVGNTYAPKTVSDYNKKIAQNAAHLAVLQPDEVTDMVDFKKEEVFVETENTRVLGQPVWIDFGAATSSDPWNNLSSSFSSSRFVLYDELGQPTGIYIHVSDPFGATETLGELTTTTSLNMPSTVSKDYFMGTTGAPYNGMQDDKGELLLSCLNKNQQYILSLFSSRTNSTINRETKFTVTGATSEVLLLDAAKNKTKIVTTQNIAPDSSGRILISVTSGPNSTNGQYHINAMKLEAVVQ